MPLDAVPPERVAQALAHADDLLKPGSGHSTVTFRRVVDELAEIVRALTTDAETTRDETVS